MLLPLVPPDHADGEPLLPLVPRVPSLLVVELGLAVPGDGTVLPGQLLVGGLRGRPLVAGEVAASGPGVGELLSVIHIVLVASRQHQGWTPICCSTSNT